MAKTYRQQKAVLFKNTGFDKYGKPILLPAQELIVRWVQKANTVTLTTDHQLPIGSQLWLGSLAHWHSGTTGTGSGSLHAEASIWQVIDTTQVPDLKAKNVRHLANLVRFTSAISG